MIAIYDQKRKTIDNIDAVFINRTDKKKICTAYTGQVDLFPTIAEYNTELQAQYVLDQIANAIERKDKLYRMPSVEEVEKELRSCGKCKHGIFTEFTFKCINGPCNNGANWQPKEQEEQKC